MRPYDILLWVHAMHRYDILLWVHAMHRYDILLWVHAMHPYDLTLYSISPARITTRIPSSSRFRYSVIFRLAGSR